MSQFLPKGGFKWIDREITSRDVMNKKKDDEKGWILEVDLEYPEGLHDLHNDFPLALESLFIKEDWLSDYTKLVAQNNNIKHSNIAKLVQSFNRKKKYVVHYRNLQFYIKWGMEVKKIHRVLEFNQSDWLKQYIEKNTSMRSVAKNDFEKDFYKLMNNSVFGDRRAHV